MIKEEVALLTGKILTAVAVVFVAVPFAGRMYQLEVSEVLRK